MRNHDLYKSGVCSTPICSFPWTALLVNWTGDISFCCFHHPFANIKNISENAMAEIWNGEVAQDLRNRWNEGRLEGTPCANCFGLKRFRKYEHPAKNIPNENNPTFSNAQLNIDEFHKGKTVLQSMPVVLEYAPSVLCNLHCIHCFQPRIGENTDSYIDTKVLLKFYNYLGSRAIINNFSGGRTSLYG